MRANNYSFLAIFFFLLTLPNWLVASSVDSTHSKYITLKAGTLLFLQLEDSISSENAIVNSIVSFRVFKARTVEGDIIFNEKCYGVGRIKSVQRSKSFGRSGLIEIVPFNIETTDGEQIMLDASPILVKGQERKAFAWVISGALPLLGLASFSPVGAILLPFALTGFLVKGHEAEMESSTIFSALVAETVVIQTKGIKIQVIE